VTSERKEERRRPNLQGVRLHEEGVQDLGVNNGHKENISMGNIRDILSPHEVIVLEEGHGD